MKILLTYVIQIFTIFLLVWNTAVQAESTIHWDNGREYKITVSDNKKPVLSISIEYQGKTPKGNKEIKHNWSTVDTDFYHISFENLSKSNLHFKEIRYFLDRGQLYSTRIKGESRIKETYGTTVIKPSESLVRNNAWVWSKKNNTLHRIFVFTLNNKVFDVDIPLVYQW
jgi:hypothetical protein